MLPFEYTVCVHRYTDDLNKTSESSISTLPIDMDTPFVNGKLPYI
jgi:hypothetical protein